jgi:hypothetical protein
MSRTRLNLFIEHEHAQRLEALATMKGLSKSAIIAAALAAFLAPESGDQREAIIAKRLDRLSRQFDKHERDQNILIETLALFVRYYLTVSIPVPEAQQAAARAQGRARFARFIEQLGRHLLRGRSLVQDVAEELQPMSQPVAATPSAMDAGSDAAPLGNQHGEARPEASATAAGSVPP